MMMHRIGILALSVVLGVLVGCSDLDKEAFVPEIIDAQNSTVETEVTPEEASEETPKVASEAAQADTSEETSDEAPEEASEEAFEALAADHEEVSLAQFDEAQAFWLTLEPGEVVQIELLQAGAVVARGEFMAYSEDMPVVLERLVAGVPDPEGDIDVILTRENGDSVHFELPPRPSPCTILRDNHFDQSEYPDCLPPLHHPCPDNIAIPEPVVADISDISDISDLEALLPEGTDLADIEALLPEDVSIEDILSEVNSEISEINEDHPLEDNQGPCGYDPDYEEAETIVLPGDDTVDNIIYEITGGHEDFDDLFDGIHGEPALGIFALIEHLLNMLQGPQSPLISIVISGDINIHIGPHPPHGRPHHPNCRPHGPGHRPANARPDQDHQPEHEHHQGPRDCQGPPDNHPHACHDGGPDGSNGHPDHHHEHTHPDQGIDDPEHEHDHRPAHGHGPPHGCTDHGGQGEAG